MPLVRIALPAGRPAGVADAVSASVQAALVEAFNVPADDLFQVISTDDRIARPPAYLGIVYSDELVIIQITANEGRTVEQKKALYKAIADKITESTGHRREDIFINLVEVKRENWSFGNGIAQYAS